jgi:hypothetical protein
MWTRTIVVGAMLTLSQSIAASGQQTVDSRAAFERMKRLVGTWTVVQKGRSGSDQLTTYKMAGGGRVLVEDTDGTLSNTFHLDVDKLMLTHYCGSGNQPRMRVREVDDRRIAFEMFDITNLANPKAYYTTHLDVVFLSDDRVELAYRGVTDGRESTQVFHLTRKKA